MLNSMRPFSGFKYPAISWTSAFVMCRASARGWTVIPGAPASTQILTASSTDGRAPPREFLSVATLLTLTESLINGSGLWTQGFSRETLTDRVGDFFRPRRDFTLILSLNHDSKQRFGSGITNQETPISGEPRLDGRDDAVDVGNRAQVYLAIDTNVHQNLWVRGEL